MIEVLLATLIFSMIVILASFSLQQGLKYYHGIATRGLNFWKRAELLWMNRIFSATIDYYVHDSERRRWYPFFLGGEELIVGVSGIGLGERLPVLYFLVREVEQGGKFALVYYELPVYTMNHKDIREIIDFKRYKQGRRIILFSDLNRVEFSYLGFDESNVERWYTRYEGWRYQRLPTLVRIDLSQDGSDDTIYLPIYVNSLHKGIYDEIY